MTKKRNITQWQHNKIQVFIKQTIEKYGYLLDEIKKDAEKFFESEGIDIHAFKK